MKFSSIVSFLIPTSIFICTVAAFYFASYSPVGNGHEPNLLGVKPGEILLIGVTAMLWWATQALVRGAEATAAKQLRAYVNPDQFSLEDFEVGKIPSVTVRIRNSGQTPAYDVTLHVVWKLADLKKPLELPVPTEPNQTSSRSTIGANGEIRTKIKIPRVGQNTINAIARGVAAFYVVGEARYRDIFGHDHVTTFRGQYDQAAQKRGLNLKRLDEGNSAT